MHLLFPFIAAISFAFGSMVFKRAFLEGAGVVHAMVINNLVLGLVFLPLLLIDHQPIPWHLSHQILITAAVFASGHLLSVLAVRIGDVSIATPLLGAKAVFVVLIGFFAFHWPLSATQWIAALLTSAGVVVMGITDLRPGQRKGVTTLLSLSCAAAFALTDVLIQNFAGNFGVWNFLPLQFAALGLISTLVIPFFGFGSLKAPAKAWRWIFLAAGLSSIQAILITGTIAIWKDAAGANVVYATRGLLSIVLVWFVGHWTANTERHSVGKSTMGWRLAGALLILVAVALVVRGG